MLKSHIRKIPLIFIFIIALTLVVVFLVSAAAPALVLPNYNVTATYEEVNTPPGVFLTQFDTTLSGVGLGFDVLEGDDVAIFW